MRVPLSWLKEYIKFELSNEDLANIMTLSGLEVDSIKRTPFTFTKVIVGEVKEVKPHPNADNLKITQVFDGTQTLQVICGDPTCTVGIKTAFAQIGASLKIDGKSLKIKRSKLRDVESFGMLCSEKELGLSDNHASIMKLNLDALVGTELSEIFGDTIIEISLTPNLGHCMSMVGIARDLAALLNKTAHYPTINLKEEKEKHEIQIEVNDPETCYRYSCRLIKNVKVGPSPNWMKTRLENAGIRSINNIVDATNYVMLELGQPLHAFDYKKISNKKISIKTTNSEITFETLDGVKRTIPQGTLMIYDHLKPIAVAGVIGGKNTEVNNDTTDILLESAYFNPSSVRKGSKQIGIRSESSARFERGVDYEMVTKALDRAAFFIEGQITTKIVDIKVNPPKQRKIKIRTSRTNQILGIHLSQNEIESFLKRLEMEIESQENCIEVTIPSYRNDIHKEIDLIEEVARIFGYNNIQKKKAPVINSSLPHSSIYILENQVRNQLISANLQEFLTCDLISPNLAKLALESSLGQKEEIHVLRPSSIDQSILRTSLLPGMLQAIKHNFDRQSYNISAFELGRVHFKDGKNYKERSTAAILLTGKIRPHHFETKPDNVNFFDLKGMIQNVLKAFYVTEINFNPSTLNTFHPGKQAEIYVDNMKIGVLGEVHPNRLRQLDIEEKVFFAQLDLHDLDKIKKENKQMIPLSQFPGSERDWTLTLKKELPIKKVFEAIEKVPSKLLKHSSLIDLYESKKLGMNKKNATFRFLYRNDRQTIEQSQVEKEHSRITEKVTHTLGDFITN